MRITYKTLCAKADMLNKILNRPTATWVIQDGKPVGQIGHFYINRESNRYSLYEMATESGAAHNVLNSCISPSELAGRIDSFLAGYQLHENK